MSVCVYVCVCVCVCMCVSVCVYGSMGTIGLDYWHHYTCVRLLSYGARFVLICAYVRAYVRRTSYACAFLAIIRCPVSNYYIVHVIITNPATHSHYQW